MANPTPIPIPNNPNNHPKPQSLQPFISTQSPSTGNSLPSSPNSTGSRQHPQKTRSPLQRGLTFDLNEARSFNADPPTEEELADAELAAAADLAFKALQAMDAVEKSGFTTGMDLPEAGQGRN